MIQVSHHTRLNPETAPLLIANIKRVQLANLFNRADTGVIYKGRPYAVQGEDVWTCFQGAVKSSAYCKYVDPSN
jgi:hypothetical protein